MSFHHTNSCLNYCIGFIFLKQYFPPESFTFITNHHFYFISKASLKFCTSRLTHAGGTKIIKNKDKCRRILKIDETNKGKQIHKKKQFIGVLKL